MRKLTIEQEKRIKSYLSNIGLSFDLQLEIYDHFSLQIEDNMENGNDFESAFEMTKIAWKPELRMVKMRLFSSIRIARIQKKIILKSARWIYFKSFIITGGIFLLFVLLSKAISVEIFKLIFSIYYYALLLIIVIYMVLNFQLFLFSRKFKNFSISSGQTHLSMVITSLVFIFLQVFDAELQGERFYVSVLNFWSENAKYSFLVGFIVYNVVGYAGLYAIYNFKKEFEKIKPFLNSLK